MDNFKKIPALLLILSFVFSGCSQNHDSDRPNIILCMADDLGWGDVGYNGNKIIKTPNLDEMAGEGIRFDRFYSGSSVCSPTRGSCLTGRNPYRYGVYTANVGHLRTGEISLAEILKNEGYTTGHFGKWHLGTMVPDYSGKGPRRNPADNYMNPGMAGFDEWFSTEYAVATYNPYDPENAHGNYDVRNIYWHNGTNIKEGLEGDDSRIIMDKAIPFIEEASRKKKPFLAVIWFHAPHQPVVGDPEIMEKYYSSYPENEQHYYSVVTGIDTQMGRLRKKLEELGIAENTMLCFTSDNGPEGNPDKKGTSQGTAGPFRGRKRSLYEGGVRVPGIIEYPAALDGGKVVDVPCSTNDYFPTVCDLIGHSLPDRPYDGVSLLPIIEGEQKFRNNPIGFQWGDQKSLTDDQYKLVHNPTGERHRSDNGSVPVKEYELYDLKNDPYETKNIAEQHPDMVEKMKIQLHEWMNSCEESDKGNDYPYTAEWESLKKIPVPAWFKDAKFGIFIHWGAYSVIGHRKNNRGYAEWVPTGMYKDTSYYYPYLDKHFGGHPPEFGYKDIVKLFKAEKWDPEAWAELFDKAGARYVVLTAEHHDGFALWDSEITDWCATKIGPERDLVGELCKAVKDRGMKFSPSYHRERHPGFFANDLYAINSTPRKDIAEEIRMHPSAAGLYGPFSYTDEFIEDYALRWKELQEKYKPDFMWFDDIPIFYVEPENPQTIKFRDSFKPIIADYMNAAESWDSEVYLNNKGRNLNWPDGIGCHEMDNMKIDTIGPIWENPATLGTSYGYAIDEDESDSYKSPTDLIQLLCDVVSKNGNLLLNIGPRADGTIPEGMQSRLLEIGKWLEVNGEAIYGSRHWKEFGEGPEIKQDKREVKYTPETIRYTTSQDGNIIYVMQMVGNDDGTCTAGKLGADKEFLNRQIKNISVLGSNETVEWDLKNGGLKMKMNGNNSIDHVLVWKILLEN